MSNARYLNVRCPNCGAPAQRMCFSRNGREASNVHNGRIQAYVEKFNKEAQQK